MNAKRIHRQLSLESLETRTLLAGADDLFGLKADFDAAEAALSGDYVATFTKSFGNRQLVITGSPSSSLTIDLDQLPDFITNLKISSFASVTLLGKDDVDTLILKDIGVFSGAGLDVNVTVDATNVRALTLDTAGQNALLVGTTMDLSVRSLADTMLFTNFDTLKISSESEKLFLITENPSQTIQLTYRPESLQLVGVPESSVEVRIPGSTTPPTLPDNNGGTGPITNPGSDNGGSGGNGGGVDSGELPGNEVEPDPEVPSESPIPDEVIVINFPADERMREFLASLRGYLKAAAEDPNQTAIQFVNLFPLGSRSTLLALGESEAEIVTPETQVALSLIELQNTAPTPTFGEELLAPVPESDFKPDSWGFAGNPLTLPATDIPSEVTTDAFTTEFVAGPVIDSTTPLVAPSAEASAARDDRSESQISEIVENVRAFGGYLVERVSAEFTPGQQSAILLVDPRPARGGAMASRNTALESFARSGGKGDPDSATG